MDILIYLQIFASITHAIILFFLPQFFRYKTYVVILVVLTALSILVYILRRKGKVPLTFGVIFVVYAIVIGLYALLTPAIYSTNPIGNHTGSLLCLAGQILPNGLFACFVAEDEKLQVKVKRLAPIVGSLFAVIALICTLRPSLVTSNGLMDNENGLGNQRVSYMAAYSAALMEYYLLIRHQDVNFLYFRNKSSFCTRNYFRILMILILLIIYIFHYLYIIFQILILYLFYYLMINYFYY